MRFNEITTKDFKDELKEGPRYSVYVLSRLGKHYEGRGMSYDEAKRLLNNTAGQYQSDVFPNDPLADIRWHSDGEVAVMTIPKHSERESDIKIEFAMERDRRV